MVWLGVVGSAAAQAQPPAGSDPSAPPAAGQPDAAPPPAAGPVRAKEFQLQVDVGGEFFIFADQAVGNGPAFMLSAHWLRWWGPFMLGGGPSIHYSYMFENKEPKDKIHQATLNGDFVIGGGIFRKFAIYAHILFGAGVASVYDGETKTKLTTFWARAVGGIGGWVHVARMISLGVLVDVGWPGTVEVLATVGFHFGKMR